MGQTAGFADQLENFTLGGFFFIFSAFKSP